MKPCAAVVLILALLLCAPSLLSACSIAVYPPFPLTMPEWGPDMAAVSGSVVGYVDAEMNSLGVESDSILQDIHIVPGLKIEIDEQLFGPAAAVAHVFPLGVDPSCEPIPWEVETLEAEFPLGVPVTVVGSVASTAPDVLMLTSSYATVWNFGFLARHPTRLQRTPSGFLDFHWMRGEYEEIGNGPGSSEIYWRNLQRQSFEDYEYLRALQQLTVAEPSERAAIAEHVTSYRGWSGYRPRIAMKEFKRFLRLYLIPRSDRAALVKLLRRNLNDPANL